MRIPKSFRLGPHEVQVSIVSEKVMMDMAKKYSLDGEGDGNAEGMAPWGLFVRGLNRMYIHEVDSSFCKQQQLATFWHESFHALFHALNLDQATDEVLVDQCGMLMLQLQQSMKY